MATQTREPRTSSLTPEQIALRRHGLGASEVAAVLGLDPHRTALDVYLEKTGEVLPFAGNRFTEWGVRLEPVIVQAYQERHGDTIASIDPSDTIVGPEPWMLATPDRIVLAREGATADAPDSWGLECKCRGSLQSDQWGEDGTDEVPHAVAVQAHWGMVVTGLKRWDVAVLLGGNDYREYTLEADNVVAAGLYAGARKFWFDHVQAKVHPPFTGADSDHKFLLRRYPTHTDEMVQATLEQAKLVAALAVHKDELKEHERHVSALEAQLKEMIGDRLGLEGPDWRLTWKHMDPVEVRAFTRPAHRRLSLRIAKKGAV